MSFTGLVNGEDIRRLRKRRGLTQKEVAEKAGVSQSLIARIENNTVDPRLSTVRKILSALSLTKGGRTAKSIMHSPVITVKITDSVRRAVELMKKHDVSQIPVIKGGRVVGSVQESTIMNRITRSGNFRRFFSGSVYTIMEEPFTTVNPSMRVEEVLRFLSSGHPAVLVTDRGSVEGIITKIDVLSSTLRFEEGGGGS
jgi:predicted transcriptional regulator